MNRFIAVLACLTGLLLSALVLAQDVPPPDPSQLIDAVSTGKVIAIAAAAIVLLVNILKQRWAGGLMAKLPKRWRIIIPVVLGGVAGILSSVAGGMSWLDAIIIGLFSGPTAVFAHEAVVESLLGKSKSRTTTPPKQPSS